MDLHSYFYGLGSELFEMHKLLLQSPTLVTFSPQQWQQHTAHFSLLLKRTLLEGRESSSGIVYRNGLLAMRLAAILTIFRKYTDYAYAKEYCCTDDDFRTAMDIAHTLLEHSLLLSTSLPDTSLPPVSMHKFHQLEDTLHPCQEFLPTWISSGPYRKMEPAHEPENAGYKKPSKPNLL